MKIIKYIRDIINLGPFLLLPSKPRRPLKGGLVLGNGVHQYSRFIPMPWKEYFYMNDRCKQLGYTPFSNEIMNLNVIYVETGRIYIRSKKYQEGDLTYYRLKPELPIDIIYSGTFYQLRIMYPGLMVSEARNLKFKRTLIYSINDDIINPTVTIHGAYTSKPFDNYFNIINEDIRFEMLTGRITSHILLELAMSLLDIEFIGVITNRYQKYIRYKLRVLDFNVGKYITEIAIVDMAIPNNTPSRHFPDLIYDHVSRNLQETLFKHPFMIFNIKK